MMTDAQRADLIRALRLEVPNTDYILMVPVFRTDANVARQALADELDRVLSALRRAQRPATVLGLAPHIDALLSQLDAMLEQVPKAG